MNVALQTPAMTRDQFLDWAAAQEKRYEFDGVQPVAMTGGSRSHSRTCQNIYFALRARLRVSDCDVLGPDAGLATSGNTVRYPDALVTCTNSAGSDRLIPGVIAVFEVLSPGSARTDRIDKLREYRAVASIRRYIVLEYTSLALTMFVRATGDADWTAIALTAEDVLPLPKVGCNIPVAEFYDRVTFED